MLTLGYHTSTTAGFVNTMNEVKKYGANTFQFFTRNPRGSKARELDRTDMEAFIREKNAFGPVVAHAVSTIPFHTVSNNLETANLSHLLFWELQMAFILS